MTQTPEEKKEKVCSKCGESKPVSEFNKEAKRSDGLYPYCKPCLREHRRVRYEKRPRDYSIKSKACSLCNTVKPREEFRIYPGKTLHYRCVQCEDEIVEHKKSGVLKCSSCKTVKPLKEFPNSVANRTTKQCKECHSKYHRSTYDHRRNYSLIKSFGITIEQYKELLEKQNHTCPVCLVPFEKDKYSYPVDHAHSGPNAGKIRAIVHDRCNRFVLWKHEVGDQLRRAADIIDTPLTDWLVPEHMVKPVKKRKRRIGVQSKNTRRKSVRD